jgi:UDP-N-acetylmuramoylalanine--D-glutamate ligase
MADHSGERILILGAARQGLALARYLAKHGARVTLNDNRPADALHLASAALEGLPVRAVFGGHPLDLLDEADRVCLSGGIPLNLPVVQEAARRGIPLSNDSQIFMEIVPCPVVGITGSAGKTTTTTLVGRMAQAAVIAPQRAWIGGNIGLPLIDFVDQMGADDICIVEFSSFQLEQMTISPQVSAVLNVTPNHLDRHGTMEAYTAAKARILAFQNEQNVAVLGRDDPGAWNLREMVRGGLVSFGLHHPAEGDAGTFLAGNSLCLETGEMVTELMPREMIELRGQHNLLNVLAACAVGHAAGFSIDAMQAAVSGFHGVPHRLEFVREWHGAAWYNDSIATAPERTIAAIRSFDEPLVLLLGGRDKNLPWGDLAALVHERVDHLVVFGEAAEKIAAAVGAAQPGRRPYTLARAGGLHEAIQAAAEVVEPGDVVLLSPGGTSFDEFTDFEQRGERYRQWLNDLS